VACACLDASRLATLAEPSTRHEQPNKKKIQGRAMRSCALIRLHKIPHLRSAASSLSCRYPALGSNLSQAKRKATQSGCFSFCLCATKKIFLTFLRMNSNSCKKNDISLARYDIRRCRMIYLLCKYDIISVPSYAEGIYRPPKVDIISKIYHPFWQERIPLKNDKFLSKLVVFLV